MSLDGLLFVNIRVEVISQKEPLAFETIRLIDGGLTECALPITAMIAVVAIRFNETKQFRLPRTSAPLCRTTAAGGRLAFHMLCPRRKLQQNVDFYRYRTNWGMQSFVSDTNVPEESCPDEVTAGDTKDDLSLQGGLL